MSFGWEERDWGYLVRGMWNEGCGIWDWDGERKGLRGMGMEEER